MKQLDNSQLNAVKGGIVEPGAKKMAVLKAVKDDKPATNPKPASNPKPKGKK